MKFKKKYHLPCIFVCLFSTSLFASMEFTKPMLEGRVLKIHKYGSILTVKFIPTHFKSYTGDIVFHFDANEEEQDEILSYKIIDGKIIFYGYDGSKHRMTLLSVDHNQWTILEEEDMDGDDPHFSFGKGEKDVYTIVK